MNTAVQAAHNLSWKLAWVVRGWAGDGLLDSYEVERRPAGHDAAWWRLLHPEIFDDFDGLAAKLGLRYRSAVIAGDDDGITRRRAPHRWLRPGLSTLDLFDRRLTLLTASQADPWRAAARRVAARVPLTVIALSSDVPDPHCGYARDLSIDGGGAELVRPDGHVSWRTANTPFDPDTDLADSVAMTVETWWCTPPRLAPVSAGTSTPSPHHAVPTV